VYCYKKGKGVYHGAWGLDNLGYFYLRRVLGSSEARARSDNISIAPYSHKAVFSLLPV